MASGKLEFVDDPKLGKVGDKVKVGTEEAFIVGSHSSKGAKSAKEAVEKEGLVSLWMSWLKFLMMLMH